MMRFLHREKNHRNICHDERFDKQPDLMQHAKKVHHWTKIRCRNCGLELLHEEREVTPYTTGERGKGVYLHAITLSLHLAEKINIQSDLQGVLANTIVRGIRQIKPDKWKYNQ
jgi:hypothetical protein